MLGRLYSHPSERVWFFFFSSRRRHTIFKCDWSSDVCSSDLYFSCGSVASASPSAPLFICANSFLSDHSKIFALATGAPLRRSSTNVTTCPDALLFTSPISFTTTTVYARNVPSVSSTPLQPLLTARTRPPPACPTLRAPPFSHP